MYTDNTSNQRTPRRHRPSNPKRTVVKLRNLVAEWAAVGVVLAVCAGEASAKNAPAGLDVQTSAVTGLASFVTADGGGPIAVAPAAGRATADPSDFLLQYGHLFGVTNPAEELTETKRETDALGHTHTSYQQVHHGVRVFSGVLRVHQNPAGEFIAANGDFYPISPKLNTTPALSPSDAESIAAAAISEGWVEVERSELVIVDPGWYGDPVIGAHLAYYVILADTSGEIREAFFIDARAGDILDRWTLIHTAKNRSIHDLQLCVASCFLPGPLARSEGDPAIIGSDDVNAAYDYHGDAYDYYFNAFGRDSIDNQGMTMVATVNLTGGCPNAYWNGYQMAFCPGLVIDDVVGHELTHGVTQSTAGLIYQNQSGQLNESFSDVFGELVDLFNGDAAFVNTTGTGSPWPAHLTGPGLDTPNNLRGECSYYPSYNDGVRWLVGEEATVVNGAIRDMWDPTCFGDPDRANSPLQVCNLFDSGGVHSGSGVPNHAFAMVTDGKTFNGYAVNGIGPIKSGAVWYRALTQYLTDASDFQDAFANFNQAAADLVGTSPIDPRTGEPSDSMFTDEDAADVRKALLAVEMDSPGRCGTDLNPADPPSSCPTGETTILLEDFEGSLDTWAVGHTDPPTPYFWETTTILPQGRPGTAMFVEDLDSDCAGEDESAIHSLVSPPIELPELLSAPTLSFVHYMDVEAGYDGGNLKIEVDGGAPQRIEHEDFLYNSYNVYLLGPGWNTNPLAGEPAWNGDGDEGWVTSVVDLSRFASGGETIQIRFEFGKDQCAGEVGWYVDDFRVYECDDCNTNSIPDQDDIAAGTSADCNSNGHPDECEVLGDSGHDCNTNGVPDDCDIAGGVSTDCDLDAIPDECEQDSDGDGLADDCDECDDDPLKITPGNCGCGNPETCDLGGGGDGDDGGPAEPEDLCPDDPNKTEPGECGCSASEEDTDQDGTPDCKDLCADDPNKVLPGACGCDAPDTDSDGDGVPNCIDGTPDGAAEALRVAGPDEVIIGQQARYTAQVVFADGTSEDVSERVTWRVLDIVLVPGRTGLYGDDTISSDGVLTVSTNRDSETTLSVMATFDDGPSDLQAAKLIKVLLEDPDQAAPPTTLDGASETPAEQPTGQEPTGQEPTGQTGAGQGAAPQRSGAMPCAVGIVTPLAFSLLLLGFVKVSRTRRSASNRGHRPLPRHNTR